MDTVSQNIYLNIPKNDLKFVKTLAKKMGWTIETKESVLRKYIASRPKHVALSEDDILEEIKAVRYTK